MYQNITWPEIYILKQKGPSWYKFLPRLLTSFLVKFLPILLKSFTIFLNRYIHSLLHCLVHSLSIHLFIPSFPIFPVSFSRLGRWPIIPQRRMSMWLRLALLTSEMVASLTWPVIHPMLLNKQTKWHHFNPEKYVVKTRGVVEYLQVFSRLKWRHECFYRCSESWMRFLTLWLKK